MSIYDRVHHIMVPLREASPEQRAWIAETADLCDALCAEQELTSPADRSLVSFVLQTAAECLWQEGQRDWGRLDVDGYVDRVANAHPAEGSEHAHLCVHVLSLFFAWMAETKRMRRSVALRQVRRLLRHCTTGDYSAQIPMDASLVS